MSKQSKHTNKQKKTQTHRYKQNGGHQKAREWGEEEEGKGGPIHGDRRGLDFG